MRYTRLALLFFLCIALPLAWGQSALINGDRVIAGNFNTCFPVTASGTAYACSLSPAITTYLTGTRYTFKADVANTAAATLNLNALGAKTIKKLVGSITTDLVANDLRAGQYVDVIYDGTNMQMLSQLGMQGTVHAALTTTYQVLGSDFDSSGVIPISSGTFTVTLVASGATQPAAGKSIWFINYGSGVVTIARSGQNINGGTASLVMSPGTATQPSSAYIVSDGTNYFGYTDAGNPMTTAGDLVYGGTSGLPTRLATGTAKQLLTAGTTPAYISFPDVKVFPSANCVNAVAGAAWDGTTPAPICRAGTNNLGGVLPFADAGTAQFELELPLDWDTTQQPYINLFWSSATNTTGTMIFQAQAACTNFDGSITDDPAFTTALVLATKTATAANRAWSAGAQFTTVTSGNNCVPGGTMRVKVTRNTDTAAAVVWVQKATVTIPRLLTVQAN